MTRRTKEVACQVSVLAFLLLLLSLDDVGPMDNDHLPSVLGDNNRLDLAAIQSRTRPTKRYKLSPLTKIFLMKLENQTQSPISTLYSDFVLKPNNFCPLNTTVDYLIVVNSATNNFQRRLAIRTTFGQANLFGRLTTRCVFLLGRSPDEQVSRGTTAEADQYNDIVQGDFHDSYHNLTLKGVMGLRWINESCSSPKLIVKIDDDVFLNVFRVVSFWINRFQPSSKTIGCDLLKKGTSRIFRDVDQKWAVDQQLFKGFDTFPFPHCKGYFVAMTGDLVEPMLKVAKITPFFWIDDVYLYGLLPLTLKDVTLWRLWRDTTTYYSSMLHCMTKGTNECKMAVFNGKNEFHQERFYNMWGNITVTLTDEQMKAFHWTKFSKQY